MNSKQGCLLHLKIIFTKFSQNNLVVKIGMDWLPDAACWRDTLLPKLLIVNIFYEILALF